MASPRIPVYRRKNPIIIAHNRVVVDKLQVGDVITLVTYYEDGGHEVKTGAVRDTNHAGMILFGEGEGATNFFIDCLFRIEGMVIFLGEPS